MQLSFDKTQSNTVIISFLGLHANITNVQYKTSKTFSHFSRNMFWHLTNSFILQYHRNSADLFALSIQRLAKIFILPNLTDL